MAQTLEHRMQQLQEHGVVFLSANGINPKVNKDILGSRSAADGELDISSPEFLGYFGNRGAEFVVSRMHGSKYDLRKPTLHQDTSVNAAMHIAQSLGMYTEEREKNDESISLEVHAIVDPSYNMTHYFAYPSRKYMK